MFAGLIVASGLIGLLGAGRLVKSYLSFDQDRLTITHGLIGTIALAASFGLPLALILFS